MAHGVKKVGCIVQILLEDLFNSMRLLERLNSVLIMYLLSDNKDIHEVIHRRYLRYRKINLLATSALLYE